MLVQCFFIFSFHFDVTLFSFLLNVQFHSIIYFVERKIMEFMTLTENMSHLHRICDNDLTNRLPVANFGMSQLLKTKYFKNYKCPFRTRRYNFAGKFEVSCSNCSRQSQVDMDGCVCGEIKWKNK